MKKQCECLSEMHPCQLIGGSSRPNPDCELCGGTGMVELDPWTRIEPRNKKECDELECFYCRYGHHNLERFNCYKYQEFHR